MTTISKTVFAIATENGEANYAYPTLAAAEAGFKKTKKSGLASDEKYKNGKIIELSIAVHDGQFWDGDRVSVDLHTGGSYNAGSIHSGGEWSRVEGIARVDMIWLSGEKCSINGALVDAVTGRHIQRMEMQAGKGTFPYKNEQLISRAGA